MPVSSPWAPAAGWRLTARMPEISASAPSSSHSSCERALRDLVGRQRVEVGEARQAGRPLVELRVVLHGARAERVEPGVDRVVELRQVDVVADDVGLVHLGQGRRRGPPGAGRDAVERVLGRVRDLAAAATRAAALEERRLEALAGDAHARRHRRVPATGLDRRRESCRRTAESAPAKRAMSARVVTSVAHTSSPSASVGSSGSASARTQAGQDAALEQAPMDGRGHRAPGRRTR